LPGEKGSVYGQSGRGNYSPKLLYLNGKEIVLEQTYQQADLLEAFGSSIQAGDKTFKASGEMGLRDIRIAEAVYKSAAKGGVSVEV
jgi:predicted dehydrogenase